MDTARETQMAEFFKKHGREIECLAHDAGWLPRPGSSMELDVFLLPDGFSCPEEETYAELFNALQFRREQV